MAKLVLLSAGQTGRTHELNVERTTIGRVEDNSFQIADPSVSSHHCEALLRGNEVVIRDLNSTNGTFINGEKISESPLKAGQVLRLGQVEMRLEIEPHAPALPRKPADQTLVMQRGVSLDDLEAGTRGAGFDTKGAGFSKKEDSANKIFIIIGVILAVVIVGLLIYVFKQVR